MTCAMRAILLLLIVGMLAAGCARHEGRSAHLMMLPPEDRVASVIGESLLESLMQSDTLSRIPGEILVIVPPLKNNTMADFDAELFTVRLIDEINDSGQNRMRATVIDPTGDAADARYVLAGVLQNPEAVDSGVAPKFLVCQFSLVDADDFSITPWQAAWVVPLVPEE